MDFAAHLKELRLGAGLSQEKLAEQLGVSRQVVTKWETGRGTPDMDNLIALSRLFGISADQLLLTGAVPAPAGGTSYESVTEYDVAEAKRFSFKLWNVRQVTLTGSSSEKLIVRLSSQTLPQLQQDFKISLDDVRGRLDVELNRRGDVSRAAAREGLDVTIELPQAYVRRAELKTVADLLAVGPLACEDLEVDGKLQSLLVDGFSGALEINCNQDMQIDCRALTGSLDVNQLSAITRVRIGRDMPVSARCRGLGNSLYFERGGQSVPDFSDPEAETVIELNGVKSELFICAD